MKKKVSLWIWLMAVAFIEIGFAQLTRDSTDPNRNSLFSQFEKEAPKVGKLLPDLEAFDENGQPFRLSSLQGNYTVLVFGCLT